MIQRTISIFCLALSMLCFIPRSHAQRGKSEIGLGYGHFSSFSFANKGINVAPHSTSSGVTSITYRYYLSRIVTLGVGMSYENISSWASFFTVAPEVTVSYMDTRKAPVRVKLYGGISYGISVLNDLVTGYGEADESGVKMWGLQVTPIGIRVGRQFAFFAEVGYGYKGLINGGLSLRVPRVLKQRMPMAE